MTNLSKDFKLTGPLAGKTINLGNYRFENGIVTVIASAKDMPLHEQFLARNWEVEPVKDEAETTLELTPSELETGIALEAAAQVGKNKLAQAMSQLDVDNDEHWTREGKPSIATIAQLSGMAGVKRKDLDELFPEVIRDGYNVTTNQKNPDGVGEDGVQTVDELEDDE